MGYETRVSQAVGRVETSRQPEVAGAQEQADKLWTMTTRTGRKLSIVGLKGYEAYIG